MQSVLRLLHLSHLLRSARTRGSSCLKLKSCFQPFLSSGDDCYGGYTVVSLSVCVGNSFHKVHVTVGQTWTEWQWCIINSDLWAGCSNDITSPEHGCQYSHFRQLEFHHFYMAWLQDEKGWEKLMGNHVTTTKNEDTLLVLRVEKVGLHPHTLKEKKFWRSVSSSEASSMISCLISIIRVNMIMNSWLRDSQCECMYLYFHLYFLYLLLNSYLHFYLILIGVNMIMKSWLWVPVSVFLYVFVFVFLSHSNRGEHDHE